MLGCMSLSNTNGITSEELLLDILQKVNRMLKSFEN